MLRKRCFKDFHWGQQVFKRDFRVSDYAGISGAQASMASIENIENIGASSSSQYATLYFAEGNKAKSQFSFNFVTTEVNVPPNAVIDDVSLVVHFTTKGTFGTGASLKFAYQHNTQSGYTYSNYQSNASKNSKVGYNTSVKKFESLRNLKIWFDFTCGSEGYDNPRIEFYGATLTITWHMHDMPE